MMMINRSCLPVIPLCADVRPDPEDGVEAVLVDGLDEPHDVVPSREVILNERG